MQRKTWPVVNPYSPSWCSELPSTTMREQTITLPPSTTDMGSDGPMWSATGYYCVCRIVDSRGSCVRNSRRQASSTNRLGGRPIANSKKPSRPMKWPKTRASSHPMAKAGHRSSADGMQNAEQQCSTTSTAQRATKQTTRTVKAVSRISVRDESRRGSHTFTAALTTIGLSLLNSTRYRYCSVTNIKTNWGKSGLNGIPIFFLKYRKIGEIELLAIGLLSVSVSLELFRPVVSSRRGPHSILSTLEGS